MICSIPKNIYLKVLDVCKKARLICVQDADVLIYFDDEELKDIHLVEKLEKILKSFK